MAALKHEAGSRRTWTDLVAFCCLVPSFWTGAAQAGAERTRAGGHSRHLTTMAVLSEPWRKPSRKRRRPGRTRRPRLKLLDSKTLTGNFRFQLRPSFDCVCRCCIHGGWLQRGCRQHQCPGGRCNLPRKCGQLKRCRRRSTRSAKTPRWCQVRARLKQGRDSWTLRAPFSSEDALTSLLSTVALFVVSLHGCQDLH